MTKTLLVVSTVHPSDDPRIRFKFIATLMQDFDIVYATKAPGPSEAESLRWLELRGGRASRWFRSLAMMFTVDAQVVAIHDPELIPAGLCARLIRRRTVVFDLHEDLPAQIKDKASVPRLLRGPVSWFARGWLKLAERYLQVTLAEPGYQHLFATERPVFQNYPVSSLLPEVRTQPRSGIVYVGDVTRQRGALTLLEAVAMSGTGAVIYVGRCNENLRDELNERARALGVKLDIRGWQPYPVAMAIAASAVAGVSPLHDTANYRNSLPTKTLEYLAVGTPVVASDLPGTAEILSELPGVVLVTPGDVADLARALSSVDAALAQSALEGAQTIREQYQWPTEKVRALYDSLARR